MAKYRSIPAARVRSGGRLQGRTWLSIYVIVATLVAITWGFASCVYLVKNAYEDRTGIAGVEALLGELDRGEVDSDQNCPLY